jgi:hypothetical protein
MKDETGKTVDPSEIDDMQRLLSSGPPEAPIWKKGVAREKPCGLYTLIVGILATCPLFLGLFAAYHWYASTGLDSIGPAIVCQWSLLIGLVFGVWAWIIGARELRRMKAGITPDGQRGIAITGMVLGIIATVVPLFALAISSLW